MRQKKYQMNKKNQKKPDKKKEIMIMKESSTIVNLDNNLKKKVSKTPQQTLYHNYNH